MNTAERRGEKSHRERASDAPIHAGSVYSGGIRCIHQRGIVKKAISIELFVPRKNHS